MRKLKEEDKKIIFHIYLRRVGKMNSKDKRYYSILLKETETERERQMIICKVKQNTENKRKCNE